MIYSRRNPFKPPEVLVEKPGQYPAIEEISSEEDLKNFYRLRYMNLGFSPDRPDILDQLVDKEMERYGKKSGKTKVFVIRDQGKIIAGASLDIGEFNGQQAAYLSHKFVDQSKRGLGLSAVLVGKRLQLAREAGCTMAYSRINKDNFEAIRAITKEGFDIASAINRPGLEFVKDPTLEYFAYRDIAPGQKPSQIEFARVQSCLGQKDLNRKELLVGLKNKELIEQAFKSGFVGKYVFNLGEISKVRGRVMYLEKSN